MVKGCFFRIRQSFEGGGNSFAGSVGAFVLGEGINRAFHTLMPILEVLGMLWITSSGTLP